jgi:hypothetical protein
MKFPVFKVAPKINQRFLLKSDSFIVAAFEIQLATIGGAQLVSPTQKVPTEERRLFPVGSIKSGTAAYKSFHRQPSQDSALLLD